MQLIRLKIQHGKHRAGTRRGSPFKPPLMVHASELMQNLDWPNAHTINHADHLSDLYTDTCIDKENPEADTNIDFGLLTTKDIDPYLNCTDNRIELSACTLTCSNHLSHMYSISSGHQPNHPSSHGDTAASALQQTDKQDTGRGLIQTRSTHTLHMSWH